MNLVLQRLDDTSPRLELRDPQALQLLRAVPDLGDGLDAERYALACDEVVAASAALAPTARDAFWAYDGGPLETSLLIVEGLLLRRLIIDGRCCAELVGPGDIVRPWDSEPAGDLPAPTSVRWRVINPTRVAFLDPQFITGAAAWPELLGALLTRAVRRSQSLAVHLTVSSMPRVDDRLWLLFWHLADRWGTVTAAGVRLDLPLTHELLAELVGSHRPTATSALARLAKRGLVARESDGAWRLSADRPPPAESVPPAA